jgi:hypothetical protein
MSRPPHSPWFNHPNNIRWRMHIMKFIVISKSYVPSQNRPTSQPAIDVNTSASGPKAVSEWLSRRGIVEMSPRSISAVIENQTVRSGGKQLAIVLTSSKKAEKYEEEGGTRRNDFPRSTMITQRTAGMKRQLTWKQIRSLYGRDSSFCRALGYELENRGSRVRFPAAVGNFSLHHRIQNGSGFHSASYPMGTRGSFVGGNAARAWSWPLTSI